MSIGIKPLGIKVIVKMNESKKQIGGLVIPKVAQEKPTEGTVVAVSNGAGNYVMQTKVGDVVYMLKGKGHNILINEEQYVILDEPELWGIKE